MKTINTLTILTNYNNEGLESRVFTFTCEDINPITQYNRLKNHIDSIGYDCIVVNTNQLITNSRQLEPVLFQLKKQINY